MFFVTFCTANRQPWLSCAKIHDAFKAFCTQSPNQAGAWVGKYVLMPDHVHVFVSVEGSQALSRWVGSIKQHLAKVRREMMNEQRAGGNNPGLQQTGNVGRPCAGGGDVTKHPTGGGILAHNQKITSRNRPDGRAWQDGFFDHLLRTGESYGEKWVYVRMNPVRAGLVNRVEDWPFTGEIESLRW